MNTTGTAAAVPCERVLNTTGTANAVPCERVLRCAALTVVLFWPPPIATAQTPAPAALRLTLDDAVRRGLETSHRIAEAVARGEAAEAVVGERRAAALPQIAAQAGYTRTNHVDTFGIQLPNNQLRVIYPDIPDNYRTRLDLQWPVYTGGRLDALERAARIDATASADETATARADLTLEISRAFWSLVTTTESLRVVQEAVTRIAAHLKDVRNQLAAGLVPPSDVFAVEAQESRQRMLAVQARAARDVAEAELARLVGVAPGTALEAVVELGTLEGVPYAAPAGSLATLIDAALHQRPERAALVKRFDAATERRRAAAAGTKPVVAVGGGMDYARPNPRIFPREEAWRTSWDASVNLNWPVFDGGRARSEMAEAAASARAVQERLADFDASLAVEIRQRLSEIEASRAAIDAASDAVRSATEARRVLVDRFAAGVATSTDVLDAQVALLQAELDRTQAIANAHLADARLARAVGK
jgi:outer membrane protein TolC